MSDVEQAKAHFFAALDLLDAKRFEAAEPRLRAALAIVPDRPSALVNLGAALYGQDKIEEAIAVAQRAVAIAPDSFEAWLVLGSSFSKRGFLDEALAAMERAVRAAPGNPQTLIGRATVFSELKQLDRALADYRAAAQIDPDQEDLTGLLLGTQMQACDWTDFEGLSAKLLAGVRTGTSLINPFTLLSLPSSAADQLACANAIMVRDYPAMPAMAAGVRYDHGRIRLAYVSGDFRRHPLSQLMAGVIEHHDRSRFEVHAISYGADDGTALRARVAAGFDRFTDVRGQSDAEVANLIRTSEADIAVDLGGFTNGGRPRIFMHRPAPIQVSYLGFPGTSGSPALDYLLADWTVIPAGNEAFYSEKIVRLPDTYYPNDNKLEIATLVPSRAEAGLPVDGFVFGCFNNNYKITPDVFDTWMSLLRDVPDSVLWLVRSNAISATNLKRETKSRGVDPDRVIFAPNVLLEHHLARHRLADLFLDTAPYNAHTTACDALWAGVPMITYPGETFPSRVAASLLYAIGMPELIAQSLEEYRRLALSLVRDPARLASIRAKLAANRDTTALFDTARLTRHLESAYTTMVERHRGDLAPQAFNVQPIA